MGLTNFCICLLVYTEVVSILFLDITTVVEVGITVSFDTIKLATVEVTVDVAVIVPVVVCVVVAESVVDFVVDASVVLIPTCLQKE